MGLASALSFNLRQDGAIVSRTIPMTPPDKREEWIIRQARQRLTAERGVFLGGACAGDAALRERLERLLDAHGHSQRPTPRHGSPRTAAATL
jgi:hypothetical protein